ncbi:MAG: START-like domain-containing protein [Bacteroidetes bacterium]|nr:START-like domain-containing protein [Bacteroidota bacterium]MCL6102383.1 START-like domain-containing protein [Bacteroidota bacterium]
MMKRIELEYQIRSSSSVLFSRLSTASGLAEWFADNVLVAGAKYTFVWGNTNQSAELLSIRPLESVKFKWLEAEEPSDFEFLIVLGEIIEDLSLLVIDHVEEEDEEDVTKMWDAAINRLRKAIGS